MHLHDSATTIGNADAAALRVATVALEATIFYWRPATIGFDDQFDRSVRDRVVDKRYLFGIAHFGDANSKDKFEGSQSEQVRPVYRQARNFHQQKR